MPTVTTREYHPSSGALLGNATVLDFGTITAGSHSRVKVLDFVFNNVSNVGNIKIGLIASGGITVIASNVGHFGIEDSSAFSSTKANAPLISHFAGLNSTGLASDSNNKAVGARTSNISNYVYLDIELGSTNLGGGNGAYKIFFDYS